MAQKALGEVKPASTTTALRATNNQTSPPAYYPVQAIQFQALSTNTGSVYIVDRETPSLTANVHHEIPAPSAGPPPTRPTWSVGNPAGTNPINANDYWILPAVSGEGVRVTVLIT
jgi:hypothetical protein